MIKETRSKSSCNVWFIGAFQYLLLCLALHGNPWNPTALLCAWPWSVGVSFIIQIHCHLQIRSLEATWPHEKNKILGISFLALPIAKTCPQNLIKHGAATTPPPAPHPHQTARPPP